MAMQQQQRFGLQTLTTTSGKRVVIGPQAQEVIKRDAINQALSILNELQQSWQQFEQDADNEQARPPREQISVMHARTQHLHELLRTYVTFTAGDPYWESGSQNYGPNS